MSVSDSFFKAANVGEARSEILKRLGGDTPITAFICEKLLDYPKSKSGIKKFPMSLSLHGEKPQFHLSDGEMLNVFYIDVSNMTVGAKKYAGSYDSIMQHLPEQLGEGGTTPQNTIAVFVTEVPASGNMLWHVDIVSSMLQKRMSGSEAPPVIEEKSLSDKISKFGAVSEISSTISVVVSNKFKYNPDHIRDIEQDLVDLMGLDRGKNGLEWNNSILKEIKDIKLHISFETDHVQLVIISPNNDSYKKAILSKIEFLTEDLRSWIKRTATLEKRRHP